MRGSQLLRVGLVVVAVGIPLGFLTIERLLWSPVLRSPALRDSVFRDVTLIDPGRRRIPNATIEVQDGRIASAGPTTSTASTPAERRFAGHFALPGLIDLHVHHLPSFAVGGRELFGLLFLAHGVTSVRDTGSLWGSSLALARDAKQGARPEPRIFACGPLLTGIKPTPIGMRGIETEADARSAVQDLEAQGADCVKIHNGMSRESVLAVISEARRLEIPVVAHVPDSSPLAAMAGAEVQHLMKLSPSWSRVRHDAVERYVKTSSLGGIRHTPTLVVFDRLARRKRGEVDTQDAVRWMPRYVREILWNADLNPAVRILDGSAGAQPDDRLRVMKQAVKALSKADIPIGLGTDTPNPGVVPGAAVHRELALLVQSGLSLEQAWAAGTSTAGRALGVEKLGTLEAGAPADLLLFREDPTRELAALESLAAIMVGGRVYRKSELEAALERQREYFERPLYDRVSMLLARIAVRLIAPSD